MATQSNLIERHEFDAAALVEEFPTDFDHPNKQVVYDIACPPGADHSGTLTYSRWRDLPLPPEFDLRPSSEVVITRPDFYDYEPALPGESAMEWHVNFADPVLFVAFNSGLFAQDEMQVAEHPALGSLADALTARGLQRRTVEHREPTPVLISGVERRCRVATNPDPDELRPSGLYGYLFSEASVEAVRRATSAIEPPTITNLIAMAGPLPGYGEYSLADVAYVLTTAYTAFTAAQDEAGAGGKTVVHSGFWGCGAFGGNRHMMTMLQAIAANMAGIDHLVLHTGDEDGVETVQEALDMLEQQVAAPGTVRAGEVIQNTLALGLKWGFSDGN